jgi:dienelactone hydrolase
MTAGLDGVCLSSGGATLLGGLYRAALDGPRPAVFLLHGIPGHEQNLDLAQSLRACGMHVLYIHYRGSWGSGGTYHLDHLVPDALAAIDWLAHHPLVRADRIGLAGISLGGWTALAAAGGGAAVHAVAALSPLLDPNGPMCGPGMTAALAADFAAPLQGITPGQLLEQWRALAPLSSFAAGLRRLPVLLVTGDGDELFPPEHYASVTDPLPGIHWERFPRADHVFSDVRPGLCHLVTRWFLEQLAA